MINTAICKICFVLFTLFTVALCIAKSEAEIEQPKTLRGGILRKSENCKHKVSGNSKVKLHYRARVWGSDEFYDNTYLANEPLQFKLGRDKMMKGLKQGIQGMCEGEIRRLLIPADLAYGQLGLPNSVPGNTAVVYEVEMLYVNSPFSNPWFWTGLSLLVLAFIFSSKFNRMGDAFKSAKFLESKEAAITNRGSSKITKTD